AQKSLWAQDAHFSQFAAAPLEINPAMSGIFNGKFKANLNYRSQWGSIIGSDAFKTAAASYDIQVGQEEGDYFSFNVNLLRDEAGAAKVSLTKGNVGVAYHKKMWDGQFGRTPQYLVVGAQAGFGQYALNSGNLWFSSQFNSSTTSVDYSAPTNEPWVTNAAPHFNFNVGALWYSILGENFSIYAGGAMQHINQPNVSFYDDNSKLDRKITGLLGGQIPITREISLLPGIMAMSQGPSFQSVFGGHIRYSNRDWWEIALRAGVFARVANKLDKGIQNDAIIFSTTFDVERMSFGVSYDMNVSSLQRSTNRRGAFEVSMSYRHPNASKRHAIECPKF
ncbi:MAG TPA: type IX secretion system membrane protein PorP/SprF, partial [Saprospiraceae bacterium]|nr:type IX secretion system membrane protein PorP/SprF [Saprospiraceae bacterium]